jgi:tRNA A-37 threonylcarbamoyl transferase component Bud32
VGSGGRAYSEDAPTKVDGAAASYPPDPTSSKTLPVGRTTRTSFPTVGTSSSVSLTTAVETLRVQEIGQTRAFVRLIFILAVATAGSLALVGGDPIAKRVLLATIAPILVTAAWLAWSLRREEEYRVARVVVSAYVAIVAAFGGIYFFGAFSPAPIVLPFGLYFFGGAKSRVATFSVFLTCAAGYACLVVAIASGVLIDRGLVRADALGLVDRAVILALVELTMLVTYLNSRAARAATLTAIERHDRVIRGLAQREALLKEAREELDRALLSGGMGRFTDTTIGSFRLGRVIGRGAMGEVYEAAHAVTQTLVAVKLLHSQGLGEPDALKRFLREAQIAQSLDTPHVVKVLEIGGLEAALPYIAMERLQGEDLGDYLRAHKQLSLKKTITLVRQVGRGLESARAAGIVHRDLKPRNLFFAESGGGQRIWKILDFGISKLGDPEGTHQTKDIVVGTPGYMAPEQAAGREVSHKTDLFALGAIVYRTLTGRPAFTGDHIAETMYQVAHAMPPRPSELSPTLPADVDLVLSIALAKAPGDRFESAAEIASALDEASRGELSPLVRSRGERLLEKMPWGWKGA